MDKSESGKSSAWTPEDCPKRAESAFRRYGDQGWVVHLKNPANTLLNDAGARVFELLDGRHKVQEIAETLSKEFDVSLEQAEQDVLEFLEKLQANQMLA